MITSGETLPVELARYPYPFRAAFTVSSDIDSASPARFRAVHSIFCRTAVIAEGSPEWIALGLDVRSRWYDPGVGGIPGLGLNLADTFFLFGDPTTFGMYRHDAVSGQFREDQQDGENCAELIRQSLRRGEVDTFHTFLHYTRQQVEPLLRKFYAWCEREAVSKPFVWNNHSAGVTPSGICPDQLQPSRLHRLSRYLTRTLAVPVLGREYRPLRHAFTCYQGDSPGSRYYINDLLAQNGLRYVWLNYGDVHRNKICLPACEYRGQHSILHPVEMDDGVRYYRFDRCYGHPPHARGEGIYLADSHFGYDSSYLISDLNLQELCAQGGTCILATHWTHSRSLPFSDETIARFRLLKQWEEAGRVWVAPVSQILEWTRRRTFLDYSCLKQDGALVIEIKGIGDPIFGSERVSPQELHGLWFRLAAPATSISVVLNGELLPPDRVGHAGADVWLTTRSIPVKGAETPAPITEEQKLTQRVA